MHVVAGAPRSGKSALVARLLEEHKTWRALRPGACPCCVGRVELQVNLARLLREERPERVFVELPDPGHLAAFRKALGEWPLVQYVRLARTLHLPDDAALNAAELRDEETRAPD